MIKQQRSQTRTMREPSLVLRESHYPTPSQSWADKERGNHGFWARPEAGNTVALCSRSKESLAETGLQAEREVLWLQPHPAHRPPASAFHWLNLAGSQMSSGALHTQPARVGTVLAEQGKGAEQTRRAGPGQRRYHCLHLHIKRQAQKS